MVLAIVGPTAAGKSALAMRLAESIGASILSVDSMQVYRGMDIGTAKPSLAERARVMHHMIDLVDPEQEYSVAEFQRQARAVIAAAAAPVIIVGGSGLHFRAVVDPLEFPPSDPLVRAQVEAAADQDLVAELVAADPDAADHLDMANPRRVIRAVEILRLTGRTPSARAADPRSRSVARYEPLIDVRAVGIDPGPALEDRIARRLDAMVENGFVDEVRRLRHRLGRTASQAVGYRQLIPVVDGSVELSAGLQDVRSATIALAKRQRTYFRPDPRIAWLPATESSDELWAGARDALELE